MRPCWSRSRARLCLLALAVTAGACTALPAPATPTAVATTAATPLPPTLAGISGSPRAVGEPITFGDLVVTVRRVLKLDAGSGSTYVGVELLIQASGGGALDPSRLPRTALLDQGLHVYNVDPAATSAALAAARATPAATPSLATPTASPAAGTPAATQSVRAVVGFLVPTGAAGLQLLVDGRPSGGAQVLVNL